MESKPLMILKFGNIKYADYSTSPEALELSDKADYESKADLVEIIKAFNGEFHLWWEDRRCSKSEAIEYIQNYVHC